MSTATSIIARVIDRRNSVHRSNFCRVGNWRQVVGRPLFTNTHSNTARNKSNEDKQSQTTLLNYICCNVSVDNWLNWQQTSSTRVQSESFSSTTWARARHTMCIELCQMKGAVRVFKAQLSYVRHKLHCLDSFYPICTTDKTISLTVKPTFK